MSILLPLKGNCNLIVRVRACVLKYLEVPRVLLIRNQQVVGSNPTVGSILSPFL